MSNSGWRGVVITHIPNISEARSSRPASPLNGQTVSGRGEDKTCASPT
jgi:hypothetical protein